MEANFNTHSLTFIEKKGIAICSVYEESCGYVHQLTGDIIRRVEGRRGVKLYERSVFCIIVGLGTKLAPNIESYATDQSIAFAKITSR